MSQTREKTVKNKVRVRLFHWHDLTAKLFYSNKRINWLSQRIGLVTNYGLFVLEHALYSLQNMIWAIIITVCKLKKIGTKSII